MGKQEDFDIVDLEVSDLKQEPEAYWEEDETDEIREKERKRPGGPGRRGQVIGMICIGAGVLCLLAGACILIKSHLDDRASSNQLEALRSQAEDASPDSPEGSSQEVGEHKDTMPPDASGTPDASETASLEENQSKSAETVPREPEREPNPYADSFLANSDMAAWLKIEGTKIDYPVMQTMEDENYYLKRGFDKKSNQNGCLILDTDSSLGEPVSTNQIIHGHNMKSGEMFGTLTQYEDPEYCKEHKTIQLYTKECLRNYEVIAVFRSQVYKKTDDVFKFYKFFQADTQAEFDDWYENIKALSEFDTGVTAEFGDRFLTLSTCVYHVDNGRLVVVARETEPGDFYEAVN